MRLDQRQREAGKEEQYKMRKHIEQSNNNRATSNTKYVPRYHIYSLINTLIL